MAYLTKIEILAAQDIQFEDVAVPEWGGTVRVKSLTGLDRDALEQTMLEGKGKDATVNLANFRAKLCARSMVDEAGRLIFRDLDIVDLGRKSAAALGRVFDVASRMSGFSQTDIEEITKNSGSGQSGDSGIG